MTKPGRPAKQTSANRKVEFKEALAAAKKLSLGEQVATRTWRALLLWYFNPEVGYSAFSGKYHQIKKTTISKNDLLSVAADDFMDNRHIGASSLAVLLELQNRLRAE